MPSAGPAPRASRSSTRRGTHRAIVAAVAISCLVAVLHGAAARGERPTRAVLSSVHPGDRALSLTTKSLYAPNDPWKGYLASEAECPGGERTDLPVDRQIAIVSCLVNHAREVRGLTGLEARPALNGASSRKANAILRCNNFAHDPCGAGWKSIVRSTGYRGSVAENLYIASGRFGAPRVAVDAWLNSEPHRANLFGPKWRRQGLAKVETKSFEGYWDVSIWVNVLGDR